MSVRSEIYHVLNRGVDKRKIFTNDKDRLRFVHNLFEFNNIHNTNPNYGYSLSQNMDIGRPYFERKPRNLLVNIHCFCLMPNHYHLLLSPVVENGTSLFMKKLNMGYAKYFNEKYKRSGALFQGKYKSILIENDSHFLHIPFYIHLNPLDMKYSDWRERNIKRPKAAAAYLKKYRWSSHLDYLGEKNFPSVTQREFLLDFFGGQKGYKKIFSETLRDFSYEEVKSVALE